MGPSQSVQAVCREFTDVDEGNTYTPVPHSAEIPVPVFKELPSLEIQEYESGEDRSDPNDEDFEIEDDSVRNGFEQHELNDLARDLELSKKASELLASRKLTSQRTNQAREKLA
ncbi:hypothetical protein AVEN_218441-1 [Araneus ventricosus]|uniref:Uncharacterized protein n=1 Tax=Araneus ventricosus TaxID=182803 RepID=A0A4Y2W4J4_ARAVE|nr:hypothetical protein AVEN_218441-1 [Araneus ventricosus]